MWSVFASEGTFWDNFKHMWFEEKDVLDEYAQGVIQGNDLLREGEGYVKPGFYRAKNIKKEWKDI